MIYNNNYYYKPFRKNIKISLIRMISKKIIKEHFLYKEKNITPENFYMVNRNESIYKDKNIKDDIEKSYIFLKNIQKKDC